MARNTKLRAEAREIIRTSVLSIIFRNSRCFAYEEGDRRAADAAASQVLINLESSGIGFSRIRAAIAKAEGRS